MEHNSIILFSTETNRNHMHKIVLDCHQQSTKWLGITFRLSKTFVQFIDEIPYINNVPLQIATEEEKRNFYNMKGLENKSIKYAYPDINYTISTSDMMPIK